MKGIVLNDLDDDTVQWTDLDEPNLPGRGEVTVQVTHAAINHLDLWVKQGLPGLNPSTPFVMGSDAAGRIIDTGEDVPQFSEDDRVVIYPAIFCGDCEFCLDGQQSQCVEFGLMGETEDGVQREKITVDAHRVYPIPGDLTTAEASVLPVAYLTAYRMLTRRSELSPGDTILVHGAGSGVSIACLQIANIAGFPVAITSHDDEKLSVAEDLGARHTINYDETNVADKVGDITSGRGVDLVVDHVGAATWETSLKCLRKGGTLVTCGATTGPNPATDIQRIFWNQLNIHGSTMGTPEEFQSLLTLADQGQLTPYVDRQFPARDVNEAHEYMGEQQQTGKLVLDFREENQ